ncbi:hypothetical protein OUZ56_017516 [Daphnia magna]|uniref:Uncharacterized protein n=1 Tax=Daphnia magna TaxID=35525 RepID=A0ABR0AT39_9CRUS|nr:hypothetical protein OUZ56_017516 [Daphnia magna]
MGDISNVPIDYEDEEIKTALEEQGIVEARRIRRKNEGRGEDIRTNMLQLTFKGELGQKLTDRTRSSTDFLQKSVGMPQAWSINLEVYGLSSSRPDFDVLSANS